jgi:TetR/AcrR family transcriptional repressor of bet genes
MSKAALKMPIKKRTAPKQERRLQLIKAAIRSIAKHGLSDTTISTVSREAELSQGIINLHFKSKNGLLLETLKHVVDEYQHAWTRALEKAGDSNIEKLVSLVEVDFKRGVCDRNRLAVWFAFWGESKSRPTYRKVCAERDRQYRVELIELCAEIIDEGPYPGLDATRVATGLSAMSEGLWLDMLLDPKSLDRHAAREICMAYLVSLFPGHFKN